eukprot:TRINITY_DN883_c0_g2_i1.p1 TRINITY_DN883_c0_g2~~TRINITY_DN883_c0_g2_i1.p1  ORF type:complete len:297 (-),score=95.91 TRINITY_DN883_c0_g2_i1:65-955(-)
MEIDPGPTKVVVIFYSLYTHTYQLAQAICQGVQSVPGVKVELYQVPEILPDAIIDKMGAVKAKDAMKEVPIITHEKQGEILKSADALIFGSPTRFGNMTAQMKSFFDGLGGLWYENAFVGKLGGCFGGSGTQHGGQETTLFSMIYCMMHLGLTIVGLPYSCNAMKESVSISGGTPYGSTHIAATDGSRAVSENEKECARFQGKHIALLAKQYRYGKAMLMGVETKGSGVGVEAGEKKVEGEKVKGEKKGSEAGAKMPKDKKPGGEKPVKEGGEKVKGEKKKPKGDKAKGEKKKEAK